MSQAAGAERRGTITNYGNHTTVSSTDRSLPQLRSAQHFRPYSPMRLTFVTDLGATYTIEIDPKMELADVMALLEAEVSDSLWCTT